VRATSGNNVNVNYFMFVPVASLFPTLTASISGSTILLKFPTHSGNNYTVLYNNNVVGGTWQPLSAPVAGDDTVKTVTDTVAGTRRFYRLRIQ